MQEWTSFVRRSQGENNILKWNPLLRNHMYSSCHHIRHRTFIADLSPPHCLLSQVLLRPEQHIIPYYFNLYCFQMFDPKVVLQRIDLIKCKIRTCYLFNLKDYKLHTLNHVKKKWVALISTEFTGEQWIN